MARRRILWGRVFASACVLIALIFLLGACVSSCFGGDDPNSSAPGPIVVSRTDSSVADPYHSSADSSGNTKPDSPTLGSYTEVSVAPAQIYSGDLVLVNSTYASHLSEDELSLEKVAYFAGKPDCYSVSYPARTLLNTTALTRFNAMMEMYFSATANKEIMVNDGYLPKGSSNSTGESTSGLSIQLHLNKSSGGFGYITNKEPYSWVYNNMDDYGFILRYPAGKEELTGTAATDTVIRYVGVPHAAYMNDFGLCLEEYHTMLKEQYAYGTGMLRYEAGGKSYLIYYVPANLTGSTEVPVPITGDYTISGNNFDGFIVTVTEG